MAILVQFDLANEGLELYDEMARQMGEALQASPGFVFHAGLATDGGWRVLEVWQSREHYDSWYQGTVQPNLPPNLDPSIQVTEVHSVIQP